MECYEKAQSVKEKGPETLLTELKQGKRQPASPA